MSVVRVTEIISASPTSFEDAVQSGIERAAKTIHGSILNLSVSANSSEGQASRVQG